MFSIVQNKFWLDQSISVIKTIILMSLANCTRI